MALAERVVDKKNINYLKCGACDDIFTNPRTLKTCNHVFCSLCIPNPNLNPTLNQRNDVNNRCPVEDCKKLYTTADITTRML